LDGKREKGFSVERSLARDHESLIKMHQEQAKNFIEIQIKHSL
jgi:hypothetical protein